LFSIENLRQPAGDDQLRIGEIEYVQAPHYRLTTLVTLHETVSVALTNDRSAVDDTVADRIADLYLRVVELIVEDKGRRAADVAEQIGLAAQAPAPAVATPPAELLVPRLTARFAASAEAPALVQGA